MDVQRAHVCEVRPMWMKPLELKVTLCLLGDDPTPRPKKTPCMYGSIYWLLKPPGTMFSSLMLWDLPGIGCHTSTPENPNATYLGLAVLS